MRNIAALAILMLLAPILPVDTHHVEADDKADFSAFKTFVVREGRATSRKAEINSQLLLTTIQDAIRTGLSSKGMKETPDRPDLIVTFSLAEQGQRGVIGRGIRNTQVITTSQGTLVIEMTSGTSLVWHGTYTDDEGDAAMLAKKLPDDAKKLISEYPPKKKSTVLVIGQAAAQPPWKSDWTTFAGVLSSSLKKGASVAELESQFGKQQVTWVGSLRQVERITEKEVSVWLTMPPEKLALADGSTVTISFLGISAMGGDGKKWEKVAAGSTVRFRTTLKGNTMYPVVAVMPGVTVIISTDGAELVEVIKK